MKAFSDYKGAEAIELWADLMEPLGRILADEEMRKAFGSSLPKMEIVKTILKSHANDAEEILLRIDDTPLTGLNVITRTLSVLSEILEDEEAAAFFDFRPRKTEETSSGSDTESTEADAK